MLCSTSVSSGRVGETGPRLELRVLSCTRPRNRGKATSIAQVRADMALHNEFWSSLRSPGLEHAMPRRTKPSHMCLVRGGARETEERKAFLKIWSNNVEVKSKSLLLVSGSLSIYLLAQSTRKRGMIEPKYEERLPRRRYAARSAA